jgi:integrase
MHSNFTISRKDKYLKEAHVMEFFTDFINDAYSGKRTRKDGKRISSTTIANYVHLQNLLTEFCQTSTFDFKIYLDANLSHQEKTTAYGYYRKFYTSFTNYLYDSKGYFDNYVGLVIKELRCFFNYIEMERRIPIGSYHKSFFVPKEEIPIIALSVEQLNYIIYDEAYNALLKQKKREEIRDVFVFGCTVALRISDLLQLTVKNVVVQNNNYYLRVKSQKTATMTSIKLPDYAVELIKKYEGKYATLLPEMTPQWFNSQLKTVARLIPDNYEMIKVRERRGKQVVIYKDPINKTHYQLSDHITSHTMRRTAITTMLNLGMPEHIVRKISGHAANSREFYRYVQLAQQVIDAESEKVFEQIKQFNQPTSRKRVKSDNITTRK